MESSIPRANNVLKTTSVSLQGKLLRISHITCKWMYMNFLVCPILFDVLLLEIRSVFSINQTVEIITV